MAFPWFSKCTHCAAIAAVSLGLTAAGSRPCAAQQPPQRAADKALRELGIVGGGGYVPDYPAAGDSHAKRIGSPYIMYRSKFWRLGEKGLVRGRLAHKRNWELDISLDGSYASDSADNKARKGMPDLDWLAEIGPRLQVTLARAARDAKIDFELPVRAVLSTDITNLKFRGFIAAPRLSYQNENMYWRALELKLSVGSNFVTTATADYFYRVPEGQATPSRPPYKGNGGYLGSSVNLVLSRPLTPRMKLYFF